MKKRELHKRILALVMAGVMTLGNVPVSAFAEEAEAEVSVESEVSTEGTDQQEAVEDTAAEEVTTEEPSEEVSPEEETEQEEVYEEETEEELTTEEETETEEEIYQAGTFTCYGADYTITVTYDETACMPEGTELVVHELTEGSAGYDEYYDKAENAVTEVENKEISDARFFDITFVMDGTEIEPKGAIKVEIKTMIAEEVDDSEGLQC